MREHEVSWPGLHLVNSPFCWSFYLCMKQIGQCNGPSFRVVFLKSQQEVVDSERIRILSTRSPAMEDISVCQRREILQMIQKILLGTDRSFLSKASLSDNLSLWSGTFSFEMPRKRITAWHNQQQHISLGLQVLNRKKLYLFVCLIVCLFECDVVLKIFVNWLSWSGPSGSSKLLSSSISQISLLSQTSYSGEEMGKLRH